MPTHLPAYVDLHPVRLHDVCESWIWQPPETWAPAAFPNGMPKEGKQTLGAWALLITHVCCLLTRREAGRECPLLRTRYVSRHRSVWPACSLRESAGKRTALRRLTSGACKVPKTSHHALDLLVKIETGAAELIRVFLNQNRPPHGRPGRRPSTINNSQVDGGQLWSPLSAQLADTCIPYEVAFSLPRVKWS